MFRALGRFIQGLNGRYITAEDVGTTVSDMDLIHEETNYVTGISPAFGSSGNPSPVTAYGVYRGMKACKSIRFRLTRRIKSFCTGSRKCSLQALRVFT